MNAIPDNSVAAVDDAIMSRHSVRAFRSDPVSIEMVREILFVSSHGANSANMQPWRVYVVTGDARQRLIDAACKAYDEEPGQHVGELPYYPEPMFEPFQSRRRQMGLALYGLLGLKKEDREGVRLQQRRNLQFFDAPVGMIFTIHRSLTSASLLDYGIFLGNIMTTARARGLHTCNVGAWSTYHDVVRQQIELGQEEMLIGGMALGYEDPENVVNQLRIDRLPVDEFAAFLDK